MANLMGLADAQRLWQNHLAMVKNGGLLSGEAKHQALTEDEIGAQHYSAHWALASGYRVKIDPIVNLFHSQPGRRTKSPLTAPGNHNDTPPAEGKFEKTFDALAGLGALENTVTSPRCCRQRCRQELFITLFLSQALVRQTRPGHQAPRA